MRTTGSTWASTATSSSTPLDGDYWPPVDREHVVTLDDVLVEDGRIAPFNVDGPTHVAMGRFGNVMLTAGDTDLALSATAGEVVRFYFTNTANTRLFNVAAAGRPDEAGRRRQRPLRTRDVRRGGAAGPVGAGHRRRPVRPARLVPPRAPHPRTTPTCSAPSPSPTRRSPSSATAQFETLRTSAELTAERARIEADRRRAPDKTLAFESLMPLLYGDPDTGRRHLDVPDASRRDQRRRRAPARSAG